MNFQHNYVKPYTWVKMLFIDLAIIYITVQFYYEKEFESKNKDLCRQMMITFSTHSSSYYK